MSVQSAYDRQDVPTLQRVVIADAGPLIAFSRGGALHVLLPLFGDIACARLERRKTAFSGFRSALHCHHGKVPVSEIANLFNRHDDLLLERNIRRYLGLHAKRVNSAIHETLITPKKRSWCCVR